MDWTGGIPLAPCKGIRIPESGKFCLGNSESGIFVLDSGIHRKESRIPLTIGTQNPLTKYLESGFHGAQSRNQDCLGFLLNQWIFPGAQNTTGYNCVIMISCYIPGFPRPESGRELNQITNGVKNFTWYVVKIQGVPKIRSYPIS